MSPRYIRARTPIAPVQREPRAPASQETQILYGHCAEVRGTEGRYLRVRGADGYEGWLHEGFCEPADGPGTDQWGWDTEGEISMGCSMRDSQGVTIDLPLGGIVKNGWCVAGRALDLTRRREIFPAEADAIVASATGLFQGTYYQWGGITPWGADCSGMVQTVFALHGIRLLRDASQQATQGVHVEGGLERIQPADLLFFSDREDGHITHVALSIVPHRIVHLALGRGGHCLESFDRPDEYVRTLLANFRFARRILARDLS
ncbi:MAG: NlpC/P60 family protein [Gemmatimonadaceae bacterium]|nr:NlpC/P60 family protein [Gemmatimonadaceae bacterium]